MQLVFIYGLPACGKLTIGAEVARQCGYALFHNHLIVDALLAVFPYGSPEFLALRERFWIETIEAAARSGRSLVFTFCPEPSVGTAFAERVKSVVQEAGGTVCFVRLQVSEDEQERRLVSATRTGRKLRRVAVLRAVRGEFEEAMRAMPDPHLSIDTTATPIEDSARQILHLIR